MSPTFDRRAFLKLVGGGIVVLVRSRPEGALAQGRGYPTDLNAYLRIGEDGRVTVFSGKIEMGQGVTTSLAQMAAEDLGVSLDAIEMVMGDTDRCPFDAGTWGSLTTRMFGPALRAAAAEARLVLVRLASEQLGVPKERLVVENGIVSVKGEPARKVSYGALAKGRAIVRTVDEKAVLRSVPQFTVMGRSPRRLDAVDKVTGAGKYAGDIRLPGLLHARILRPPAHGATLARVDVSEAAKLDGVTVVNQDGIVAVLHADPEVAEAALARLRPEWNAAPPGADTDGIFADLLGRAGAPEEKGVRGDVAAARAAAGRRFESTFHKGYVAHAPIEPHTSTATFEGGKLTVWASTQTPFPTRDALAQALSLDPKNVRVVTPYVGGGFGGKSSGRQSEEAARLAKITGRPVQVAFTRAEEFFYDAFDPASIVQDRLGDGRRREDHPLGLRRLLRGRPRGAALLRRAKRPHAGVRRLERGRAGAPLRHRPLARARGQHERVGPRVPRRRHGGGGRARPGRVPAAEHGRRADAARPAGGGEGVRLEARRRAERARLGRRLRGRLRDLRHPRRRGEGGPCEWRHPRRAGRLRAGHGGRREPRRGDDAGRGLRHDGPGVRSAARRSGSRDGKVLDENFDTYEVPRFSWLPRIETVLVKNDALAPQGGGEPAIVPMGAAIANAVFDATGARLFRLPMTPARVKAALDQGKGK